MAGEWRRRFVDFVVPVLGVRARWRVFFQSTEVSQAAAAPWIATQFKGPRYQGIMPRQYGGIVVTPQTILRGVLPLDYMAMVEHGENGTNLGMVE